MTTEAPQPAPTSKNWYQRWWVWTLIVLGVVIVIGVATSDTDSGEGEASATTAVGETTTEAEETTTTTTLPSVLAEGNGTGDDVIEFDLPPVPVVIELAHSGDSNFAVISLDASFESIDLLVNEIGPYEGTRGMQFTIDEVVSGLEITADGNWAYQIRPLLQEPTVTCRVEGRGDDVILLADFAESGGAADLTHDGDSNFSVIASGATGRDLLVNEIGPYAGTVRVSAGLFAWDITANGNWTVDC